MGNRYHRKSKSPSIGIPYSPPGQRENRRLTMREEVIRVPLIVGTACFLGLVGVINLYFTIAVIGPAIGYLAIAVLILYIHYRFPRLRKSKEVWIVTLIITLISLPVLPTIWMANPVYFLHPFAQIASVILSTGISFFSFLGTGVLMIELIDPNFPSPRQAILRDGPFIPGITRETYGGQFLPEKLAIESSSNTLRVEVIENSGKKVSYIPDIPDTDEWKNFSRHITSNGPDSFTEAAARSFHVKLDDQIVGNILIAKGMRTIRTELIDRGFARWKSADHGRGVVLRPQAMAIFKAIGERG